MIAAYCYLLIGVELFSLWLDIGESDDREISITAARLLGYIPLFIYVLGHSCAK